MLFTINIPDEKTYDSKWKPAVPYVHDSNKTSGQFILSEVLKML